MVFSRLTRATLLWAFTISPQYVAADGPQTVSTSFGARIGVITPVSEPFRQQATLAAQAIPAHVWQTLDKAGFRLRVAEFVVDVQPSLVHDRPRGWPLDMTWQHTDAIHFPHERLLVLAEKRRNRKGQIVANSRVAGVLRHEIGHAFDLAIGGPTLYRSASLGFRQAYTADLARMSTTVASELTYYRQQQEAGRQEAFAEAFGILLGGGSDEPHRTQFEHAFPQVLAFVRAELTTPR